MFFGFILVAVAGVLAYLRLRFVWNHWIFWLAGSLVPSTLLSSYISHAVLVLSTTSFTMFPSPAEIQKLERQSSFLEETESSMDWRGGLCQFQSLSSVSSLFL